MADQDPAVMADDEQTQDTSAQQTPEEMRAELERTRKALKDANKEAADRRKRLDALEKAEKERSDKDLSESERLKKDLGERDSALTATQQELRNERTANAVELVALALDFHDTEDALRLIDLDAIEYSEDGRPDRKSIKKALEALAKAKPHLVATGDDAQRSRDGSPPSRGGSRRPNPSQGDDKEREYAIQRSTGRYSL